MATAAALPRVNLGINYERQRETLTSFFREFGATDDEDVMMVGDETPAKYMDILQRVANREADTVLLELDDLFKYEKAQKGSAEKLVVDYITENTSHYLVLLSSIIDEIIPQPTVDITYRDEVLDMILHQRLARNERARQAQESDLTHFTADPEMFPPELTRRYTVYVKPLTSGVRGPGHVTKALAAREVRGADIGHLITVRGIVTRVSDVKPSVVVAAYSCEMCGNEIFQEVKSRQFTPIQDCPSQECRENNTKGQLYPSTRASKFVPFQDVRIQELTDQVPTGQIPRTITVSLKGPLVRSLTAGDLVDLTGVFMPRPYTGLKALKAGLLTDTYLEGQYVHLHKPQYDELKITREMETKIAEIAASGDAYQHLAKSIAPEIYGHEDVKKALLLLLIGGTTKVVGDGMKIRGDINICLMGDPGVAKSQLLKFITKISPRGVYTTGRGSSGVGLTAAVIRDPVTDEMVLEGGALVLADNGVACIDEFDKMDDSDRTAIHEVMEQQTISISKAGMSTTLNARTSILAAANPIYGRYNARASPTDNINLPAALLSRFDLLFLLLDKPSEQTDKLLAEHVTFVHMHSNAPAKNFTPAEPALLREYVAKARSYRPLLSQEVAAHASKTYVEMRQREVDDDRNKKDGFGHITPRALLSIVRLSQAHARLHFRNTVTFADVDEAIRLNEASKQSLYTDDEYRAPLRDSLTRAYDTVRKHFETHELASMPRSEAEQMILARGLTQTDVDRFLEVYADSEYGQFYLGDGGDTLYRN